MGMTTNPTPAIDWKRGKAEGIRKAVLCKFETYTDIRNILLFAGYQGLVENAPGDHYWGYGQKGTGKICSRKF